MNFYVNGKLVYLEKIATAIGSQNITKQNAIQQNTTNTGSNISTGFYNLGNKISGITGQDMTSNNGFTQALNKVDNFLRPAVSTTTQPTEMIPLGQNGNI